MSKALDLISTPVVGHNRRVASLAGSLGRVLGLDRAALTDLLLAALMHDAGAFSLACRIDTLEFDYDNVEHAEIGYRLLRTIPYLNNASLLVRYHHTPWARMESEGVDNERVAILGNLINLVDRVDVLQCRAPENRLGRDEILATVNKLAGRVFAPELLRALPDALARNDVRRVLGADGLPVLQTQDCEDRTLAGSELAGLADSLSQIIDFRSRFTATHSRGVAATAQTLASLAGFDDDELMRMHLAASLHDLGKLAIPSEILEKPSRLNMSEFEIIRRHPSISGEVLGSIPGLEDAAQWASSHHEQPSGNGYPRGMGRDTLETGSLLLAAADVFTAITEDRPYRDGMDRERALGVLDQLAAIRSLDPEAVDLIRTHADDIDRVRLAAQTEALAEFKAFYASDRP